MNNNLLNRIKFFFSKMLSFTKNVSVSSIEGFSLYNILEIYVIGILKGAFTYRASAIAFNFFMALFPFALFILNLIPYIPLENFQADFLEFVEDGVPPNTYEAIEKILNDIMNNSYKGLLSSGFLISIFLMTNGVNAIFDGFEMSSYISITRSYFKQYIVALGISLLLSFVLIFTVAAVVIVEIIIQQIKFEGFISNEIFVLKSVRYIFVLFMIFLITSILYKFGTKETVKIPLFNYGAIITTLLIILTSYVFGIYVEKFARYNELYGSIGTLLVLMFYIWINCMLLLLGFELNASIVKIKKKNVYL